MTDPVSANRQQRLQCGSLLTVIAFATLIVGTLNSGFAQSDTSSLAEDRVAKGASLGSEYDIAITNAQELIQASEWVLAFKELMQAIGLNPDRPEAYFLYGRAHLLREEFGAAERAFLKTLDVDSHFSAAWFDYARLMVLKGELSVALESVREAISLTDGQDWRYLILLGEVYGEMGLRDSARQAFDDAIAVINDQIASIDRATGEYTRGLEVVEIIETTEYVTDLQTGVFEEIPVTRYQTQAAAPPKEWADRRIRLKDDLKSLKDRRAEVLATMERTRTAGG